MPEVTLPDGRVVEFPATMSLSEIEAAAAELSRAPSRQQGKTWGEAAMNLLPTAGGVLGGVVGGIGGTVAGVGVGGVPGAIAGSALGGGLGESLRQLANRARGAQAPTSAREAATAIAQQAGIQGVSEAVGAGVGKAVAGTAKAVYRGYLKPALSERMAPKAAGIVQTALDEALPVTPGAAAKAARITKELPAEVDAILAKAKGTINLHEIAGRVRKFAKAKYFRPGADQADYKAALRVADTLDRHPSLRAFPTAFPTANVSLSEANAAKRALYQSVKDTGFGAPNVGAKKTAEKFAARQLRTGLEEAAPAIAPLNARESKLIDAAKAIRRAVEREANQSVLSGHKTALATLGGGAAFMGGGGPLMSLAGGALARAAMSPRVATTAAVLANRFQRQLGIGAASAARLAAYTMANQDEAASEP